MAPWCDFERIKGTADLRCLKPVHEGFAMSISVMAKLLQRTDSRKRKLLKRFCLENLALSGQIFKWLKLCAIGGDRRP